MNAPALSFQDPLADNAKAGPHVPSLEDAILEADNFIRLEIPAKKEILCPWLFEQSISMVSGWRGEGKTWLGLSLFDAITKGKPFGPWETVTPVPALYLESESPASDIQDRLKALGEGERKAPLYLYSDAYANSLGLSRAHLLKSEWISQIEGLLINKGVKLFGLDNLSSLSPGIDENQKQDWDPINQWLLSLRFKGISTVMFHHFNKEGGQRGTSAREDNLDISINLVKPSDYTTEDGCRFILKFSKARIRTADLPLIADFEFQLKERDGRVEWVFSATKKKNRVEVLRLLSEKVAQKDIAGQLGLTNGRVCQIRHELIKNDCIDRAGKHMDKGKGILDEN